MSENTEYSYKTADQASANLVHLVSLLKKKLLAILIFTFSVVILTGIYIFKILKDAYLLMKARYGYFLFEQFGKEYGRA